MGKAPPVRKVVAVPVREAEPQVIHVVEAAAAPPTGIDEPGQKG
jgi:hypothetical protein